MTDYVVPIVIGMYVGTLFITGLLLKLQKKSHKQIMDRTIENMSILLKNIDDLKTELKRLKGGKDGRKRIKKDG